MSSLQMLLSRLAILLVVCFLVPRHVVVSWTGAEPDSPATCNNCTICPYLCHSTPSPPPPAGTGYPEYGTPPPPSRPQGTPGQATCPPGQVVSCCPSSPPPPYPFGPYGYAPPTPPMGYMPFENRSALGRYPLQFGLLMLLLLPVILFVGI